MEDKCPLKSSNECNSEQNVINCSDIGYESYGGLNDNSLNSNNFNIKSNRNSNDVIVYETNSDESFNYDKRIDVFDVKDYDNKIKSLSLENSKLRDELICLEEHIIDLINDKQCLEKSNKTQIDFFKRKIDSYVCCVEELNQNILGLESINHKLEEELNQKTNEIKKLGIRLEDIEDKLLFTSFQLSEANKNESELRLSLNVTEETLSAETNSKYETIERLNQLYMLCAHKDILISELNSQMDSLKKEISDKDNELWFFRSGDRTSIGHDFKKSSNTRSVNNSKSKDSKTSDSSAMNRMEDHVYENLSDINKNDNISNEDKSTVSDIETVVTSDEETIRTDSSTKSPLFPSLPDVILRKLQLLRESCCSIESLTEEEIESKFETLSLSFKTDRFTLEQRLNLQKHQRDVAELDANNELQALRQSFQLLNQTIFSSDDLILTNMRSEIKDLLNKIESQIEVVGHTCAKISSRSEVYGAVKQEERVSSAFDVILIHSENLKRAKERDEKELEKTKKLLNLGHKKLDFDSDSDNESVPLRRSIRSISTTVIPKMNLIRVRRASVSSIEILPNSDTNRKSVQSNANARYVSSNASYLSNRSRRCSMPASPSLYRSKTNDSELSHLEITAEERGGSESDCASSVANPESDDEHNSNPLLNKKLSEEELNTSSISSEQNNNSLNAINNNEITEPFSHRFSHENSSENNDNSCDEDIKNNQIYNKNEKTNNRVLINIIEYHYLVNLFNFCINGRIGSFVKGIAEELRFIFAIMLLITAVIIVIWSLLPTSLPCECHCYSWEQMFNRILTPYLSNERVVTTTQ